MNVTFTWYFRRLQIPTDAVVCSARFTHQNYHVESARGHLLGSRNVDLLFQFGGGPTTADAGHNYESGY